VKLSSTHNLLGVLHHLQVAARSHTPKCRPCLLSLLRRCAAFYSPDSLSHRRFRITVITDLLPVALRLRLGNVKVDAEFDLRLPLLFGVDLVAHGAAVHDDVVRSA
jgi:hypothetical protein